MNSSGGRERGPGREPSAGQRLRPGIVLRASTGATITSITPSAGGGVASLYDPIDVTQYTEPELRAAVDGDPLAADLSLLADPERSLVVVMKDGVLHKNMA